MDPRDYNPRADVASSLHDKTLVMIVGPTAIGKSSLMNHVIDMDSQFGRVSGFTTREPRPNDEPGMYRYVSVDDVADLIRDGSAVQYVAHPTTGKVYGTEQSDYPAHYNLQDTLAAAVDNYHLLPFARTLTVSMTTSTDAWIDWLAIRFPEAGEERTNRLIEAKQSIEWSLRQTTDHHWLVTQPGQLDSTAHELTELVKNNTVSGSVPAEAAKLLTLVNDLLSYK